jgi:two-component system, NarL family, response regulator NreC
MHKTRILIVDDHALVRSGLRSLLAEQPDFEIVGEAADGAEAITACNRFAPEVILMDLSMSGRGGLAAIRDLKQVCPGVQVLVVTMHEDPAYARVAMREGASGYVLKRSSVPELLTAIRTVRLGQKYITGSLSHTLVEPAPEEPRPSPTSGALHLLSARELEVLVQVALGHTSSEIGQTLHISPSTVETHRRKILIKLGLR